MESQSRTIRLLVKLIDHGSDAARSKPSIKTCLIDTSSSFPSVLDQVSSRFGDDIQSLSHIVYNNLGNQVDVSEIDSVDVLKDLDVVVANAPNFLPVAVEVDTTHRRRSTATKRSSSSRHKLYSVGTKVRKLFHRYGWYTGTISSVNQRGRNYEVEYSSDDDVEIYPFGSKELDKLVKQAKTADDNDGKDDGEIEEEDDSFYEPPSKRSKSSNTRHANAISEPMVTDEERMTLKGFEFDIDEFTEYLLNVEGLSERTVKDILHPIRKLQNGEGVPYRRWPSGVIFHPHPIGDMSDDFAGLHEEAVNHEDKYGKDQRGGQLLRKPIKKLQNYQAHLVSENRQGGESPENEQTEEEVADTPLEETPKTIPAEALTEEERHRLAGEELDLDEFRTYLTREQGLGEKHVYSLVNQVGKLKSGVGIGYSRWPDDALFHPYPLGDLSEDFVKLQQEGYEHEEKYGKVLGGGGRVLKSPIGKLIDYQIYYYHSKIAPEISVETSLPTENSTEEEEPEDAMSESGIVV